MPTKELFGSSRYFRFPRHFIQFIRRKSVRDTHDLATTTCARTNEILLHLNFCCFSSGPLWLVSSAAHSPQHSAYLLLPTFHVDQLRASQPCRLCRNEPPHVRYPLPSRVRHPRVPAEASRPSSLCQHVHPVHVQHEVQLRRPCLQQGTRHFDCEPS